jgi:[acyl-carrier-protein] S-malonyltransferase
MAAARKEGGRVIELAVSAPFHCALMQPAAAGVAQALADVPIRTLRTPVVTNVEATLNDDAMRVGDLLVAQITAPVRWGDSMRLLSTLGCARALEIGPGHVLTNLLKRMQLGIAPIAMGEGNDFTALTA